MKSRLIGPDIKIYRCPVQISVFHPNRGQRRGGRALGTTLVLQEAFQPPFELNGPSAEAATTRPVIARLVP